LAHVSWPLLFTPTDDIGSDRTNAWALVWSAIDVFYPRHTDV